MFRKRDLINKITEEHTKNKRIYYKLNEGELISFYTKYDLGDYNEKINPRGKKIFKVYKSHVNGTVNFDNCFSLDFSLMCFFRGFDKIRRVVICTNPNKISCMGCIFIKEKPIIGWVKYLFQKIFKSKGN